jgi:hypothetical protein
MKTNWTLPALPRSLDPLADESLPGFLLRLSHRLERTPRRVAVLTGLHHPAPGEMNRIGNLLSMDPITLTRFADATGLTHAEASALCLAGFRHRYPPLEAVAQPVRPSERSFGRLRWGVDAWVLLGSTRYCPQCLASDGSEIQSLHGGPWRRTWRLAVVFACIDHRRLLSTTCPGCRQPAHRRRTAGSLIPHDAAILHPAQCRSPAPSISDQNRQDLCGFRLDATDAGLDAGTPSRLGDERLFDLQRRLLDLLDPAHPAETSVVGRPTPVTRYFADLRLITALIQMTWPDAKDIAGSIAPAEALSASIGQRLDQARREAAHNEQAGRKPRMATLHERPPLDSQAAATLFLVADRILTADESSARSLLRPLISSAVDTRAWKWMWRQRETSCSPHLARLMSAEVRTLKRPRRRGDTGRRKRWPSSAHQPESHMFDHRHIPQCLPTDWCERHLGFVTEADISPLHVKRVIAIRLVQMAEGGNVARAGEQLGIPSSRVHGSYFEVSRWSKTSPHRDDYHRALQALATELDNTTDPIDYDRRRRAMASWSLPQEHWQGIIAERPVPAFAEGTSNDRRLADELSRQTASVFIWARVTHGEYRLAQLVADSRQDHAALHAQLTRAISIFKYRTLPQGRPSYLNFRAKLDAYADQLAQAIDTGAPDRPTARSPRTPAA